MKTMNPAAATPGRTGPTEQVILFLVANQVFAITADAVQELRITDSVSGAANEIERSHVPKVRHTVKRGRHTYYVVNAGAHFGLPASRPTLLMVLRGLRVAVLVDRIDRMVEISFTHPLPLAFSGEERAWYRGLTYFDDRVIPVVQPDGFLTQQEIQQLESERSAQPPQELQGALRQ